MLCITSSCGSSPASGASSFPLLSNASPGSPNLRVCHVEELPRHDAGSTTVTTNGRKHCHRLQTQCAADMLGTSRSNTKP
jgi:hypothetical protein